MDRPAVQQVGALGADGASERRWRLHPYAELAVALALHASLPVTCSADTLPAPRVLLEHTLAAHARLGPCYIESNETESGAHDYPDAISHTRMCRNDPRHSFAVETTPRYCQVLYTSGRQTIVYSPKDKSFSRIRLGSFDDGDGRVFNVLVRIRDALANAKVHPQLGRTQVIPITYRGLQCYKVIWDMSMADENTLRHPPAGYRGPLPGAYIAPFRMLVVGRNDGLVRKVITDEVTLPWKTSTQTITYQFRSRPYPSSTFVFTPPRGTKNKSDRIVR